MKKKTFALALMAIYVAVLVGGSLAYFTAEDRAVNVITIGKVDIEIVEYHRENGKLKEIHYDDSREDKGMPASFNNIEPGQRIVKKVDIENRGLNTAWIRAKIIDSITEAEELGGDSLPVNVIRYNVNDLQVTEEQKGSWEWKDGYWYYSEPVEADEVITLFDVVTFDGPSMNNDYQGCITNIQIHADAVQYEGIGATSCIEAYQKLNEVSQGGAD